MRRILSIEYDIPGYSESYERYSSNKSLLDFDLVIFRPCMDSYSYEYYDGKPSYDESSSRHFREAETHWNNEVKEFLNSGKNLIVILDKIDSFFIKTGQKEYSGTGRSRRTINIINEKSNYHFLSRKSIVTNSQGDEMKPVSPIFKDFYNDFKKILAYQVYLKADKVEAIFSTKRGNRIVGGIEKVGNGKIIYLPMIDFEIDDFVIKDEKGKENWNETAVSYGKRFIQHLIRIERELSGVSTKTVQPEWIDNPNFELEKIKVIKTKIKDVEDKVQTLIDKSDTLKSELAHENTLKDLLFENGKPLENAVIKALEILGYSAENYDDGELELDQVITSPENIRFIGECEGKDNKAIDISKLRQLSDAINEDFEKDEINEEAFGLLFGNPQRLIEPAKRTENFTTKCISAAKRRNIGLILTKELFTICKYLTDNKNSAFKKKCRLAIKNGLGGNIDFPKIPKKNS